MTRSRAEHYLRADLHTYAVPLSPKTLRETINVATHALRELEKAHPGYNAGGTIHSHIERLEQIGAECDRKRPTGPDGKHNNRHTPECGCSPHPGQDHNR
jgi:hypothetical protein